MEKKKLLARIKFKYNENSLKMCWFSYTDQMSLWCYQEKIMEAPNRGWYDPGRGPEEGFGRLLPDLFSMELPLTSGENEIFVYLSINEFQLGSGLWMRLE